LQLLWIGGSNREGCWEEEDEEEAGRAEINRDIETTGRGGGCGWWGGFVACLWS